MLRRIYERTLITPLLSVVYLFRRVLDTKGRVLLTNILDLTCQSTEGF
jgi:hypothetical protein